MARRPRYGPELGDVPVEGLLAPGEEVLEWPGERVPAEGIQYRDGQGARPGDTEPSGRRAAARAGGHLGIEEVDAQDDEQDVVGEMGIDPSPRDGNEPDAPVGA